MQNVHQDQSNTAFVPSLPPNLIEMWDGITRLDGYTATTKALTPDQCIDLLSEQYDDHREHSRGYNFYENSVRVRDRNGVMIGTVNWGGKNTNGTVMIEAKGYRTHESVSAIRSATPTHNCTRIDSCIDFEDENAFAALVANVRQVKEEHDIYGEYVGDWDKPELGRTIMLGSRKSAVRFRAYEKGKQPEMKFLQRPHWCRAEMQVRPKDQARVIYSRISSSDVWGASNWSRDLAARLMLAEVGAFRADNTAPQSDLDHKIQWCARHYGAALMQLRDYYGDWGSTGMHLERIIRKQREDNGTC